MDTSVTVANQQLLFPSISEHPYTVGNNPCITAHHARDYNMIIGYLVQRNVV